MNDTQRLDALENHGLCITQLLELQNGKWSSRWACHFGIDQRTEAPNIRDAIDSAVRSIEEVSHATEEGKQQENHQ